MLNLSREELDKIKASCGKARKYSKRLQPLEPALLDGESWSSLPNGYPENTYWLSDFGRTKFTMLYDNGRYVVSELKPAYKGERKFIQYTTYRKGNDVFLDLAKLVLTVFGTKENPDFNEVKFLNNDMNDCRLSNLQWVPKEVIKRQSIKKTPKLKTKPYIKKNGRIGYKKVLFSELDCEEIRRYYFIEKIPQWKLAEMYKTTQSRVSMIVNFKTT